MSWGDFPVSAPKAPSGSRFTFYRPDDEVRGLAEALLNAKGSLRQCEVCFNITDTERCSVCTDAPSREQLVSRFTP